MGAETHTWEMISTYRRLVQEPEGKRPLGRPRHKYCKRLNIKKEIKK
jgi:hypothetical protein